VLSKKERERRGEREWKKEKIEMIKKRRKK
jgi:hypothetical protein